MTQSILLKWRSLCLACSFLCLATCLIAQQPSVATVSLTGATISEYKGEVELRVPEKGIVTPVRGLILPPKSSVVTRNGRILLHLEDGSEILVGPRSSLVIEQPSKDSWRYLELLIGRIRAQVRKRLGAGSSFQVATPSAVISVRGTRFYAEVSSRHVTEVDVEEGLVEVVSARGLGESVLVGPGLSTRVGEASGPETPRPTRELRPQLERPSSKDGADEERRLGDPDEFKRDNPDRPEPPEIERPEESSPTPEAESQTPPDDR